jgi:predicted protein tyrosine phosphatase
MAFRLTICGLDELPGLAEGGVTHVLSILDPEWPAPAAFARFAPHRRLELRFHDVVDPAPAWVAPSSGDVERLLAFGRELDGAPAPHLLIHCHAGVSRSTACALLILAQADPQRPAAELLAAVVRLRPRAWPNLRLIELGDARLGRGGALVAAARAHYRAAAERDADLAAAMIAGGRGREVAP